MLAPQTPDGPVPDDVAQAVVGILADGAKGPGGWASGAADASSVPSAWFTVAPRTRPQLIGSLGARIAEIGRLPVLGFVAYAGDASQVSRSNSAQRLKALDGALAVPPALASAIAEAQGPVLSGGRLHRDGLDPRGRGPHAQACRCAGGVAARSGRAELIARRGRHPVRRRLTHGAGI